MLKIHRPALLAILSQLSVACLTTGEALQPRYYGIELPQLSKLQPTRTTSPVGQFRLRQSTAARHLGERMVWRKESLEYGFAEERRWLEEPLVYLERALLHELWVQHGLQRCESFDAPALDLLLLRFEEHISSEHSAEVALEYRLMDEHGQPLIEGMQRASTIIEAGGAESFAASLGMALHQVVARAAAEIASQVTQNRP